VAADGVLKDLPPAQQRLDFGDVSVRWRVFRDGPPHRRDHLWAGNELLREELPR
jgi:hypothetical protein